MGEGVEEERAFPAWVRRPVRCWVALLSLEHLVEIVE